MTHARTPIQHALSGARKLASAARKPALALAVAVGVAASGSGAAQAQVQQQPHHKHPFTQFKHFFDDNKIKVGRGGIGFDRDYVPRPPQPQPDPRKSLGDYTKNFFKKHSFDYRGGNATISPRH